MDIYLIFVVFLFVLAITDLMVGVSNDAVNFLNSAVGSRVAPRHIIMIVASLGIVIGATFSSGMMEVARKGIFNPEAFYFNEIMIIFLAVMITDIILLDAFNTLGMPTSTTVSIVFELLGAAVAVALFKMITADQAVAEFAMYINWSKAGQIIFGIVLSVFIAFSVGALVQYVVRLFFTFRIDQRMGTMGVIWGAISIAFITFFLLVKGAKNASFMSAETMDWIKSHQYLLLGIFFVAWTVILGILHKVMKVNPLKIAVLAGTFALAMAFAGNDLVNFIGVSVAGLDSFQAYSAANADPNTYNMSALAEPIRTNPLLLLGAGVVMVVTLWLSKKARTVTETEVNLGRQSAGDERFKPNALSRGIVGGTLGLGKVVSALTPSAFFNFADRRYQEKETSIEVNPPAFDLVRASVNLTVASILIAIATYLKLPLSTTYVSFMVAMGTSLSDRAWDRDSAVYRVAGVTTVIGGWFVTAIVAFSVAGFFAFLMYFFGKATVFLLMALAVLVIIRTSIFHAKKEKEKHTTLPLADSTLEENNYLPMAVDKLSETLKTLKEAYTHSLHCVINDRKDQLRQAELEVKKLKSQAQQLTTSIYDLVSHVPDKPLIAFWQTGLTERLFNIQRSLTQIQVSCAKHIRNRHHALSENQTGSIESTLAEFSNWLDLVTEHIDLNSDHDPATLRQKALEAGTKLGHIDEALMKRVKSGEGGPRNSQLLWFVIWETKNLIGQTASLGDLFHHQASANQAESTDATNP